MFEVVWDPMCVVNAFIVELFVFIVIGFIAVILYAFLKELAK